MSTSPPSPPRSEPTAAKRRARAVRLPPSLWEGLDARAAQQGVSTNALLEAMAERVTGVEVEPAPPVDPGPLAKVTVRLRTADREELRDHAKAMGYSVTGWVTTLIRASVRKAPVFAKAEVEGLMEGVKALGAVGRNLNTVVHRLHREGRWHGNIDLYVELLAEVKRVKARTEAVIAAALDRADE